MNNSIEKLIDRVIDGRNLSSDQTAEVFTALMSGRLEQPRIEALLAAMADKGETVDEIVGAAAVMRRHAVRIRCDDPNAIDTCGTGGDGISTFNVSTAAAIIAAAAGATVAKHGNRSNTRKSGSAEVTAELGVNLDATPENLERSLSDCHIAFLHAARLHPATGHVVDARKKLARPTIFNLLGPLTNPAHVRRQLVGVPRTALLEPIAEALRRLGSVRVMVVHGADGLCDLTITGESEYVDLKDGRLQRGKLHPRDLSLPTSTLDVLRVDGPAASAAAIRAIFDGERGPRRDHALINAAAALYVAGVARDLRDGLQRGSVAIDTGAVWVTLNRWIACSRIENRYEQDSSSPNSEKDRH